MQLDSDIRLSLEDLQQGKLPKQFDPEAYIRAFETSARAKAESVLALLSKEQPFSALTPVFLSIGGGDGAELQHLLEGSSANSGVLIEGVRTLAEMARTRAAKLQDGKNIEIYEGDAKQKIHEAMSRAADLVAAGRGDYLCVTCHAVLHELFDRGEVPFDPIQFFSAIFGDRSISTWLTYREPGIPEKWPEVVLLQAACQPQSLLLLAREICRRHPAMRDLRPEPHVLGDYVRMNRVLAMEVLAKLFYLPHFAHEIEERSTAVNHERLTNVLWHAIGDRAREAMRANVISISQATDSFVDCWRRYGVTVLGMNEDSSTYRLAVAESQTRVIAWRLAGNEPGTDHQTASSLEENGWKAYLELIVRNDPFASEPLHLPEYVTESNPESQRLVAPWRVQPTSLQERRAKDARPLDELVFTTTPDHALLLGQPGSGKTTALEYLQATQARKSLDPQNPRIIPVLISLKPFQPEEGIWPLITAELHRLGVTMTPQETRKLLQSDRFAALLLFDGLNEVPMDRRDRCVRDLNQLGCRHQALLISCREHDYYASAAFKDVDLKAFILQELRDEDVTFYLTELNKQNPERQVKLSEELRTLARIPLHLSIIVELITTEGAAPASRSGLIDKFIESRLFREHRAQGVNDQDAHSMVRQARLALACLAYESLQHRGATDEVIRAQAHGRLKILDQQRTEIFNRVVRSGLVKDQISEFAFWHQTIRDFAAGEYLRDAGAGHPGLRGDIASIEDLAKNSEWDDVLILLTGWSDPGGRIPLIGAVNPLLASRCLLGLDKPLRPLGEIVTRQVYDYFRDKLSDEAALQLVRINECVGYEEVLETVLISCHPTPEARDLGGAYVALGAGHRLQSTGDWEPALKHYEYVRAHLQFRDADSEEELRERAQLLAWANTEIGAIIDKQGQYERASSYHSDALALMGPLTDNLLRARILTQHGYNRRYLQEWDAARDAFRRAREEVEHLKDLDQPLAKVALGETLLGMGKIHLELDEYQPALEEFERARQLFHEAFDSYHLAQAIHKVGEALLATASTSAQFRQAKREFEESLRLKEERGDRFGIGISYEKFGKWYELERNPENHNVKALKWQDKSLSIKEQMGNHDHRGIVLSRCSKARIYTHQQDLEAAAEELVIAKRTLGAISKDKEMSGEYHHACGLLATAQGNLSAAREEFGIALDIWERTSRHVRAAQTKAEIDKLARTDAWSARLGNS